MTAPEGRLLRRSHKDGPQVIRSTGRRWSKEAERVFLDALAASCNVLLSAAEAGFAPSTVYRRRRDDPRFAERWQAALEQGLSRLEMALVQAAADSIEGVTFDDSRPIPKLTVAEAMALLRLYRPTVRGEGRLPSWPARPRSLDQLRESILTKLDAIEAARGAA